MTRSTPHTSTATQSQQLARKAKLARALKTNMKRRKAVSTREESSNATTSLNIRTPHLQQHISEEASAPEHPRTEPECT